MKGPIVFFDVETTGIDTTKDELTQLAAVALDVANKKILSSFEVKFQLTIEGLERVLKAKDESIGSITYDVELWNKTAVRPLVAINKFITWLKQYTWVKLKSPRTGNDYYVAMLAGHNVIGFDREFLIRYGKEHKVFIPMDFRMLDTMPIYLEHKLDRQESIQNMRLENFIEDMGVKFDGQAHDALVDATANALAYAELCERRDL